MQRLFKNKNENINFMFSLTRIGQMILGLLLNLLASISAVALMALSGWLICACAVAGLNHATAVYFNYLIPAGGIRAFALLRIGSRYGERLITHDVTFRILADLRVWFYRKIEPLAPTYFIRYRSGDLLNRCTVDIDTLDQIYLRLLLPLLVALTLSVVMFFFIDYISWKIALLVFLMMLFVIVVTNLLFGWIAKRLSKELLLTKANFRTALLDSLHGMKEILLFTTMTTCLQQLFTNYQNIATCQRRLNYCRSSAVFLVTLVSGMAIWLLLYFGISMVHHHLFSGAILCLLVLATLAAFEILTPLPSAFTNIGSSMIAVNRLQEIAQTKPEIIYPKQNQIITQPLEIKFKDVAFSYDSFLNILTDFNLSIPYQAKLAISGPSGIGKSTILHLLARFFDPTLGSILIGDVNLKKLSEAEVRKTMTLIDQQDHIFNMSIRDNLLIANPQANDKKLWQVLTAVNLDQTVRKTTQQLATQMGEFGECFSLGQLRRISLARALLRNSPIVLLDEPTEGLDNKNAKLIWQLILDEFRQATVIVVTHRLNASILPDEAHLEQLSSLHKNGMQLTWIKV